MSLITVSRAGAATPRARASPPVVLDGSLLRRRIAQAAAAAKELAARKANEAASKKQEYDAAERLRSQMDRQANALQAESLWFEVAELEDAVAGARNREREAKRHARAWEAAEILAELDEVEATVTRLRAKLEREIEDAVDLRGEYEGAAMRLRRHLAGLADAATKQARHADGMAEAGEECRRKEESLEIAASNRVAEIGVELGQLDERVSDLHRQLTALTREGLIEHGETAATGLVRLDLQDVGARTRLEAIPGERGSSDRKRAEAAGEVARLAGRIADLRGRHERLAQDRDRLVERATELSQDERVLEVVGHGEVDVLVAGQALSERLIDTIADAEQLLVEIQVEGLEDRRALAAIEQTSLLPAAVSVEQAVARLRTESLSAMTGWQHLAQNVSREAWQRILATSPYLLDAVVVHPGRLEQAAELLGAEAFPALSGSLTVVESSELNAEPGADRRLWTLPPAPARYDAKAAAEERGRRETRVAAADHRLNEVAGRRDADRRLLLRLRQKLDDCPPGHLDGLAHELQQQAAGLAELDQRREEEEEEIARNAGERLRGLDEGERALHTTRLGLRTSITRLEPVAAAEGQRPGWVERQTALGASLRRSRDERDRARQAKDEARAEAERWTEDASQARNDARAWLRELEQLPHFDVDVEVATDDERLDALKAAYHGLCDQYERRTTKSDLARRADVESRRAGHVRARLQPFEGEVVELARELLAAPGASSPGFRVERTDRAKRDQEKATGERVKAEGDVNRAGEALERLRWRLAT